MAMREQNLGRAAGQTQAQINNLVAQDPAPLKETHKDLWEQVARDDLQVRFARNFSFITVNYRNFLILYNDSYSSQSLAWFC